MDKNDNKTIDSITTGPRQANFELLRVIAMFGVVILHENFFSLGEPSFADLNTCPIPSITKIFFQSITIGAVNIFILISGWFGIRFSLNGVFKFAYQCLFMSIFLFISSIFFVSDITLNDVLQIFYLKRGIGWFVRVYFELYILSIFLNKALNTIDSKIVWSLIIAIYFIVDIYFGWIVGVKCFERGYGIISFTFLYLLGRVSYKYYRSLIIQFNRIYLFLIFLLCCIINTSLYAVNLNNEVDYLSDVFAYTNPITIIGCLSIMYCFSLLHIRIGIINYVAKSAFSVYLLHNCNAWIINNFKVTVQWIYYTYSGFLCILLLGLFACLIYVVSIAIDQLRIYSYNSIFHRLFNTKTFFSINSNVGK